MQREAQEQQAIVQFCDTSKIQMYAVPNGGRRDAKEAYFLKLTGVKAGVPDMCFPIPKRGFHGLYIELKVGKNKPTEAQKGWIDFLNSQGYLAKVCYGAEEAIKLIVWYMKG